MKKNNLFIFAILLFVSAITFSCKKTATNVLVGNWKLSSQHTVTITNINNVKDTTSYDTTFNPYTSQILEFNGDNTYASTNYGVNPVSVIYGKYTFSGGSAGSLVMTPTLTPAQPFTTSYVIVPANSISNSVLFFPTTTTDVNSTVHDTTFYTFY